MPIVVEALPKDEYQQWLDQKRIDLAEIRQLTEQTFEFEELYQRGQQVYTQWCVACHRADGAGVFGVFPALIGGVSVGPVEGQMGVVVNGVPGAGMHACGEQYRGVYVAAELH